MEVLDQDMVRCGSVAGRINEKPWRAARFLVVLPAASPRHH